MSHQDDLGYLDREIPYAGAKAEPEWAEDQRSFSVRSDCPACAGPALRTVRQGVPTGSKSIWPDKRKGAAVLPERVTFVCECGYPHVNRPADSAETGCGAAWKVPLA